jgi:hypothetical protein
VSLVSKFWFIRINGFDNVPHPNYFHNVFFNKVLVLQKCIWQEIFNLAFSFTCLNKIESKFKKSSFSVNDDFEEIISSPFH